MYKDVIDRVKNIATEQEALAVTDGYPIFEWLHEVKIYDENKE